MIEYNTAIVLAGSSLLGANCGMIGSYAVLRQRSLMGDALAHAALPGLCLAFLAVGERNLPAMLLGALATGVLGVVVVAGLRATTRIKDDAAIGVVLSVFFGAGVVLSRLIQNRTTTGSAAGLDSYILGKTAGMIRQDLYLMAGVSLACLSVILLLYKEFKLVAFDAGFARVQGWPAHRLDLLLMGLIAVTVVIGLPAVGVVLVAAMLILPGAAARFWTDRLGTMLVLSALFGTVIGVAGTAISANYGRMPAGPIIVLVGSALFLFSVLFAARRGGVARLIALVNFRRQLREQNLLRVLFDLAEPRLPNRPRVSLAELSREAPWEPAEVAAVLRRLHRGGLVSQPAEGTYLLTDRGLDGAANVARCYRLWELFLAEQPDLAGTLTDLDLEAVDRLLPRAVVEDLEAKLWAAGRLPRVAGPPVRGGAV